MGRTLAEKLWDAHVVRARRGRARPALHRPAPGARGDQPAGVRRAAAGRAAGSAGPDLTLATEDHNVPTTGITGPGTRWRTGQPVTDPVSRTQVETLRKNCAEFGIRLHPMGDAGQGIVHVDRPAARAHPAGHDDRLRRLAHQHARRVRGAGLRHRHQRGRARARHPDAAAAPAADDGRDRRRARCRTASPPRT